MKVREWNRDVKRLHNSINSSVTPPEEERRIKNEFLRLYRANSNFEPVNKCAVSFMRLHKINQRFRVIPLHSFGVLIEI